MTVKIISEFIGTAFLLLIIVGSGIMGDNLSGGNEAIALLANSLATGAGLFVLIQCLGPVSGAHLNPAVTLVELLWKRISPKGALGYWVGQFTGGVLGVFVTHFIFNQAIFQIASKARDEPHLWVSEIIATFGLIGTIGLAGKKHVEFAPLSIAAYISGAYWFTSSTSFANPAVTLARGFTDTFTGIGPHGIILFIGAQITGATLMFFLLKRLEVRKKSNDV